MYVLATFEKSFHQLPLLCMAASGEWLPFLGGCKLKPCAWEVEQAQSEKELGLLECSTNAASNGGKRVRPLYLVILNSDFRCVPLGSRFIHPFESSCSKYLGEELQRHIDRGWIRKK